MKVIGRQVGSDSAQVINSEKYGMVNEFAYLGSNVPMATSIRRWQKNWKDKWTLSETDKYLEK